MTFSDPNLYLGHPHNFTIALLAVLTLGLGAKTSISLARAIDLPAWPPLLVLIVHLAAGLGSYLFLGPFSMSADGVTYDAQAVEVASHLGLEVPQGFDFPLHEGKVGYPIILGLIYSVIGREPFAGIAMNSLASSLTTIVIMASSRKAFGTVNPMPIVVYLTTMPAFVTLGPAVMREAFSWLGISLVCYFVATVLASSELPKGRFAGLGGFGILLFVRTGLAVLVLFALVIALIAFVSWKNFGTRALLGLALVSAVSVVLFGEAILTFAGYNAEIVIANRDFNATTATTGYSVWMGPLSAFGISGYIVAALPNIMIGPFPWELEARLVWAWVLLSALYWWGALALMIHGVWRKPLSSGWLVYAAMAAVMAVSLAAFFSNYGVLTRMRPLPLVVLLVLLGGTVNLSLRRLRRVEH